MHKAKNKQDKPDINLGCCSECKNGIIPIKRNHDDERNLPKFAIATGLLRGYALKCLTDLNEAELALISIARVNKHMITYTVGVKTSIQRWYSMYYVCIEKTSKVMNFWMALPIMMIVTLMKNIV